jgi:hypothetical protein
LAMDASGGIWSCISHDTQIGGESLRYWDTAAVTALTGAVSNPAPTRTLTSASFQNIVSLNLDASGGAWVVDFKANKVWNFTAAQLAAGGNQVPNASFSVHKVCPAFVRFAPGYGLFPR